jgi:hypothetical protein
LKQSNWNVAAIARSNLPAVAQRAKAEATKQSGNFSINLWIASRHLSTGAHSRDPLAGNDVLLAIYCEAIFDLP